MKDIEILTELQQVKALAIPLRIHMLKLLVDEPMSASELADA